MRLPRFLILLLGNQTTLLPHTMQETGGLFFGEMVTRRTLEPKNTIPSLGRVEMQIAVLKTGNWEVENL